MPATRSSRRQQSRLTFTPLPSSSPATKGYHKQIQDRAAAVGYDSPSKRRKIQTYQRDGNADDATSAQLNSSHNVFPTPQATDDQNTKRARDGSDSDPTRSARQHRSKAKQQRIHFANHTGTPAVPSSLVATSPIPSSSKGIFAQSRKGMVDIDSDSSNDSEDVLPSPQRLLRKSPRKSADTAIEEDDSVDKQSSRPTRASQRAIVLEDSDDDVPGSKELIHDQESSGEDMPTTTGKQKRGAKRTLNSDSFIVDDDLLPELSESDDSVQIVQPRKGSKRRKSASSNDEDSEGVGPKIPGRRKLKRFRKSQEQEDLDDDLDFLGPSSDVETGVRQPRSTQSTQKHARLQALDNLKRKRSGLPMLNTGEYETTAHGEDVDESSDESEAPDSNVPTSSKVMFEADEDDEDFLEQEEDEGLLGVPTGIPLEFTRYASMKAKELFKYAVEWMVQKRINPSFSMNDEIYELTFRKLDDEIRGLAGSKFTSSAWTPEFTCALESRPEIAYDHIDRSAGSEHWMRDKCDACNRSGHPATYEIQFQGKPYNRQTLDEVVTYEDEEDDSSSSDHDDEDDENAVHYDAEGREVPPAANIYYVGKFCKANAVTAHALRHWKYHLNAYVHTWLIKQGYDKPEEIVKRDRSSSKKRRKLANKIVDRMEREGVIKDVWREFKSNVDVARNSKQGRWETGSP